MNPPIFFDFINFLFFAVIKTMKKDAREKMVDPKELVRDDDISEKIRGFLDGNLHSKNNADRLDSVLKVFKLCVDNPGFWARRTSSEKEAAKEKLREFYIGSPDHRNTFDTFFQKLFNESLHNDMELLFGSLETGGERVTGEFDVNNLKIHHLGQHIASARITINTQKATAWMPQYREVYIDFFRMETGFQGKKKCTTAFGNMCKYFRRNLGIDTIRLYVNSGQWEAACKCYIKGAKQAGLQSVNLEGGCENMTKFIFAEPKIAKVMRDNLKRVKKLDIGVLAYFFK
jgi:hypothetical protein